mmetsp:Transcript_27258/g.82818  ORF Transcript_27258/g.82818 Transcript_27258/m.82818 type:complete len:136 (+) Transcript_27258:1131-1538(+)
MRMRIFLALCPERQEVAFALSRRWTACHAIIFASHNEQDRPSNGDHLPVPRCPFAFICAVASDSCDTQRTSITRLIVRLVCGRAVITLPKPHTDDVYAMHIADTDINFAKNARVVVLSDGRLWLLCVLMWRGCVW